jgi:hypothetical protein
MSRCADHVCPMESNNQLNCGLIIGTLQITVEAIGESIRDDTGRLWLMLDDLESAPPSLRQLVQALRAEPMLDIFNNKLQVLPDHATRWQITNLAEWLIRRALDDGASRAVADLNRYVEAAQLPFTMVLCIKGLEVNTRCDLTMR